MPNALDDYVWDGAVWDGGELPSLPATIEELCLAAEAVWTFAFAAKVEEC